MKVDLEVPFAQKEKAKALGARWNASRKVWYVPDGVDAMRFTDWLPRHWVLAKQQLEGRKAQRERDLPSHKKPGPVTVIYGKEIVGSDYKPPVCDCNVPPWEVCPHSFPWART